MLRGDTFRLLDIVHADQKLYLVLEFLDLDLKRYMERGNQNGEPIRLDTVKASSTLLLFPLRSLLRGNRLSCFFSCLSIILLTTIHSAEIHASIELRVTVLSPESRSSPRPQAAEFVD
jgi:hypothetical protein